MNRECIDPKIGSMLHAYELGSLSDSDLENFEIHLMECEFCFKEVSEFEAKSQILLKDNDVQREVSDATAKSGHLKDYLWPDCPLIFKPAIAIFLILLLIYPAYLGISQNGNENVRAVRSLSLFPTRSGDVEEISLNSKTDFVLSFAFPDAVERQAYSVDLRDDSGNIIYENESFTGFDRFKMGSILISSEILHSGTYRLIISDSDSTAARKPLVYDFVIELEKSN